ncbi:MAG: hypothetical protein GY782_07860 [Gammaproteobacteria bacterium]|nr:hypothetical protein [Gammaproteobacteria bacterium]
MPHESSVVARHQLESRQDSLKGIPRFSCWVTVPLVVRQDVQVVPS